MAENYTKFFIFSGTCPGLFLLICNRLYSRTAGTRMPWHPVPSRAASAVLAGRCFDLQSAYQTAFADFLCFIIRKLRLAVVVCIAFFNEEYLISLVDFIVALRRTKGRRRRTLRSPPSPSSGLHLIHPGLSAAAGHIGCRG